MSYFLTGGTGFIGRHLLARLLARGEDVYCLARPGSESRLHEISVRYQALPGRIVPVSGDLLEPGLGVDASRIADLTGGVKHFFHCAALYDLAADSESLAQCNVGGTRHAMELATAIEAGCFHYLSTVAVAGHYEGTFTESMLDEAEGLTDPYASTKHDAELLLRREYGRAYRIYRPSVVVGHSETGEIDKVDGLYFAFRLIQRLHDSVPDWLPRIGLEGGSLNVVPVDFVANAVDHLAHAKDLDYQTFHLVDPEPHKTSEVIDIICDAAGAPRFSTYLEVGRVPRPLARLMDAGEQLPALRRLSDAVLGEMGIPRRLLGYLGHSTEYGCEETLRALADSEIEVPPLSSYAERLWTYWHDNLASTPGRSARLARAVEGRTILIAHAAQPVERAAAQRLAASGAKLLLVDRDGHGLDELTHKIVRAGGSAQTYKVDLGSRKARAGLAAELSGRPIDVLICGSSQLAPARAGADPLCAASLHHVESVLRSHFVGALDLVLALAPHMRERGAGQIVLLSPLTVDPHADLAGLGAAAALEASTNALAETLAADGVSITSVHLPPIEPHPAEARPVWKVSLERAATLISDALVERPRRSSTWLGAAAEVTRTAAPQAFESASALWTRWAPNGTSSASAKEPQP